MSTPATPVGTQLPHRSTTVQSSGTTTTNAVSDDESIIGEDTSETTKLLLERLRAWKHMCGYLENYIETTAKVQKSQSKDYEKVLKTISDPLREGHHFDQDLRGVAGMFENLRNNTKGISNLYIETEKNLKGSVLPILQRLHKEIKSKSKELKSGAQKGSKAVDKARTATQKHIELLGQYAATHDSAAGNKVEPSNDPYVLRRRINHRLNKQIIEENNTRQDTIAVQSSFQDFEAHVIQTVQHAMSSFFQFVGGQLDRQRAMYGDIVSNAQGIPLDYEWTRFVRRNDAVLIDPDSPPRSMSNISFPNQDHPSTRPLIEGTLERKSRTILKGYSTGYYVVTPARYLHEFKDNDDYHKDPTPELSLYLPDCVIGGTDGVKFNVKGKDVSSGKVGNAFQKTHELSFKAHTPADAEKWWTVIKETINSGPNASPISPISPTTTGSVATTPAASRNVSGVPPPVDAQQDVKEDTKPPVDVAGESISTKDMQDTKEPQKAGGSLSRSTSGNSHYHTAPGGSKVDG